MTSTPNPIGDGFCELVNQYREREDVFVVRGRGIEPGRMLVPPERTLIVGFHKGNLGSYLSPRTWARIRAFFRKNRITRALFYSNAPVNYLISRVTGVPAFSLWVHDPVPHPCASKVLNAFKGVDNSLLLRSPRLEHAIVANRYLKSILHERHPRSDDPYRVIPLPCIQSLVPLPEGRSRDVDVLFFGRIEPYKGLDVLLRALRRIDPRPRAVICGKGDAYDRELLDGAGVDLHNRYVPNDELRDFLARAKVCVFPYTSGTGTQAVQTALASGCRTVLSDIPSFRDFGSLHPEKVSLFPAGDDGSLAEILAGVLEKGGRPSLPADPALAYTYSVASFSARVGELMFAEDGSES